MSILTGSIGSDFARWTAFVGNGNGFDFDASAFIPTMLGRVRGEGITTQIRMGMLVNGVDINSGPSGVISATHGDEEMATTVDAFRVTLRALRREGALA